MSDDDRANDLEYKLEVMTQAFIISENEVTRLKKENKVLKGMVSVHHE